MAVIYPVLINSPEKRSHYLYRSQELLRQFHNLVGDWAREGITQKEYDNIGTFLTHLGAVKLLAKMEKEFPYVPKLPEEDWNRFTKDIFDPMSWNITDGICDQRVLLKDSVSVDVNLDDFSD